MSVLNAMGQLLIMNIFHELRRVVYVNLPVIIYEASLAVTVDNMNKRRRIRKMRTFEALKV
ncbi:CLUMA_CG021545, isoform A [Clunio marinus]|uniref:CLUMA_CG021545, isoform A n=1 Tax=Clunio marinus TaxID=568069 RepID=A0A1J1J7W8_9DIPT|nr:CLUMA_CG021545, isoform A [Clunio marinus]